MSPIAVAIVNYNTRDLLRDCLATVQAQAPHEVVVVDNGSIDGSVAMVQTEYPWVVLHASRTNLGYGAAANRAISRCKSDYVLLLNADTRLQAEALEGLITYLDLHPRAAVLGPRLVDTLGTGQISCHPFPTPLNTLLEISILGRLIRYVPVLRNHYLCTWPHTRPRIVPWVVGAALAIRREAFMEIGGFDESFFMYSEEVDLCYRLNSAGWQVHFAPVARVVHVGGASTVQQRAEMNTELFASILLFYRRHYSARRVAQLAFILKTVMLIRLVRDTLQLCLTRDGGRRAKITEDMATWQKVLLGHRPKPVAAVDSKRIDINA